MNRLLLLLAAATTAAAETPDDQRRRAEPTAVDAVVVQATALPQNSDEVIRPVRVVHGAELDRRLRPTLGATLAEEPGIHSSHFGPGVGRPIIRGLDGARVAVLDGGIGSMDASTISADHAVAIDPWMLDRIEVLKGPATLLFGPAAIGGVVNAVQERIIERPGPTGIGGRGLLGYDSADRGRMTAARVDLTGGRFTLHANGSARDSDDLRLPGALRDAERRLENSAVRTSNAAVGSSVYGDWGFAGIAVSTLQSRYGIPGGHGHEHQHAVAARRFGKDLDDHAHEAVEIDLEQLRFDAKAAWTAPFAGIEQIRLDFGLNDYRHVELEGEDVGTRFDNDEFDGRLKLIRSRTGAWQGAFGLAYLDRDFAALGEEAFVPPVTVRGVGAFWIERGRLGSVELEVGARLDRQRSRTETAARQITLHSLSLALRRELAEGLELIVNLDRAQRGAAPEELYADGPHLATQAYEIGRADLAAETARQLGLGLRHRSPTWRLDLNAYVNRFADYIYLRPTGAIEDELPVFLWSQADARFAGFELESRWRLAETAAGRWELAVKADAVRARLRAGGDLPRIAPARIGAEWAWIGETLRVQLGWMHYRRQQRTAEFETPTPGFHWLTAEGSWVLPFAAGASELYLRGENLGDRVARVHTSFLKDRAPLPGRNFTLGVRLRW